LDVLTHLAQVFTNNQSLQAGNRLHTKHAKR